MARNPYLAAWRRRTRNQRRLEGPLARLARVGVPLVAAALLVPLVRPVFLSFLDLGSDALGEGVQAVTVRAGLLVVAVLALEVYTAVVRSPDRAVLDLHPVDPRQVVSYAVLRVLAERAWLAVGLAVLLLPIGFEASWGAWGLAVAVVLGAYAVGLGASAMVHLLAVDAAENPRLAPVLDAIRGHNPRAQAAFIYAPGVVLTGAGLLVVLASGGARAVIEGDPTGAVFLALPVLAGALAWLPVPGLADRAWFRATGVLADIDARYAALDDREEALRVYLDWLVRFLPSAMAPWALRDLRHGWRARRGFVTAAWLVGVGGALAGWTSNPAAPGRAVAVGVAGAFLCAAVAVVLERDEPVFLRSWLPPGGAARWGARAVVLAAWLQPCVFVPAAAIAVRHGFGAAAWVVGVGELAVAAAVAVGMGAGRLPRRGLLVYGPVAALAAAGVAAWATGGLS